MKSAKKSVKEIQAGMKDCGVPSLDKFFAEFKKATKTFIDNQTKYDLHRNAIFKLSDIDMVELDYNICIAIKGLVIHCYKTAASLEGKDISNPDTWFVVTDAIPFIEMKLLKDVLLYKDLMTNYPPMIMQLAVCIKDTPGTLIKLMKMKDRAKAVKEKAKPEIQALKGMKKIGAMKNFAVNLGGMISIISTIKRAIPMYAEDMVSLKDTAMALKDMLNEAGRADCEMMGKMCLDNEECVSVRNCYEECYGPIPPALTSSERKWKNKCIDIDELLFPMPKPEEPEMEQEMEEKIEMTEEEKKKCEEDKKKEEEKRQKEFEKCRKEGAMKHYKKTKERFYEDKTKFLEKFIAYLKKLEEDKDEAFDQEQLDTCCKEQEEHLEAVKSAEKKKDLIKKAKMAAAMGKTAMEVKEKIMPGKKEDKKE